MHDLNYFREHLDKFAEMARNRGVALDVNAFRELDRERRQLITAVERLKAERNKASDEIKKKKKAGQDASTIIAEMKRRSPSRGLLREDFDAKALAPQLERAGAVALSILTEEDFFQGSLKDLRLARAATQLPVLRKDFVLDPWQVWEARATGADSFLLIVAILSDGLLRELLALGRELGMEALVEVHTREELLRAVDAGAHIIGVNNRDLRTMEVRLETSLELAEAIPDSCIAVSESGIRAPADLARLREAGFDSFLIGERLMESRDPAGALRTLLVPFQTI